LNLEDESAISEISILPDGRVYLFGASRQVLESLYAIPLGDPALGERIDCLRMADAQQSRVSSAKPNEEHRVPDDGAIEKPSEGVMR
jgi:hypothetical protein